MDLTRLKDTPPWEWPKNTAEVLAQTLWNSKSTASDRMIAVELAGDLLVINDRLATLLLNIVRSESESEDLRARAAISFGPVLEQVDMDGFDDPIEEAPISEKTFDQIRETLRKVYADERAPKEVRRRALEASVRAENDWHADAIRAALATKDEEWMLTAAFSMRWVEGFDNDILEMIRSPHPLIHYEAVLAAGEQDVDEAWPHILGLLQSKTTEKRLLLAAIESAGQIRPEEADPILRGYTKSKDPDIAEAAEEALLMAGPDDDDDEDDPF